MHLKFAKETLFKIVYLHEILTNTDTFLRLMFNNISYNNAQVQLTLGHNVFVLDASFFSSSIHGDTLLIVMRHLMDKYSVSLTNILKHSSYDVLDSIFSATHISASTSHQIAFIDYMLQKRNIDVKFIVSPVLQGSFSSNVRRSFLLNVRFLTCRMAKYGFCLTRKQLLAIRNFFNRNTFSTGFLINKIIEDFHTKGSVTDSITVFSDMSLFSLMCINPYLDDHDVKSTRKAIININDDKEEGKELSSPTP